MHAAFDRDCITADKIFIIGYSFMDEHINSTIKTARVYNKDVKITIVDPKMADEDFESEILKMFLNTGMGGFPINKTQELGSPYISKEKTFKDFLQNK